MVSKTLFSSLKFASQEDDGEGLLNRSLGPLSQCNPNHSLYRMGNPRRFLTDGPPVREAGDEDED